MDRSEEVLTELLEEVFHLRNQVQNLIESFESDQPMLNTIHETLLGLEKNMVMEIHGTGTGTST
jgi:hypothetical protein